MTTIDFARSFLTFRIDTLKKPPITVSHKPPFPLNNARIQIECRLEVVEKSTGQGQIFFMGANCKTEQVGVPRDIWLMPNADFVPIMSADKFLTIKTYACLGQEQQVQLYTQKTVQPDRQLGRVAEAFDSLRLDVMRCPGELLESGEQIVAAVLANENLVARTTMQNDRYQATIEYPIKTINANERDIVYQTDTGPILFPDLSAEPDRLIERIELAFSAFNSPDWIELIVRTPTDVAPGVRVHHYSQPLRLEGVTNQILRAKSGA
ncbi:MAG: hypothetical protein AB7O62_25030 [Pirellulales bacterium]